MHEIDVKTAKMWIDQGDVVLIDVREPEEFAVEAIPGAILIPLSKVNALSLPDAGGKKIVVHCRSGKRSAFACEKLLEQLPDLPLYNLQGGIMAWSQAGYPTICGIDIDD